ncbi:MAG: hypothetical protein AAFW67_00870 [Cyanobacteria bacterium J06638_38]
MLKFTAKQILFTLLIASNIFSLNVQAEDNNSTTTNSQKSTSILQAIISLFKSPESRFISRGDDLCLISPTNSEAQLIWSDRPLFIWQGDTSQAEINLYPAASNNPQDQQPMWTETIPSNTKTLIYTGEQLQPGNTYDWELIADGNTYRQTMQLMEQPQREAISSKLTTLTTQLQTDGATAEDIAIAKADYFIKQQLGSDALQELYSVENPSANLAEQITNIEQHLCK